MSVTKITPKVHVIQVFVTRITDDRALDADRPSRYACAIIKAVLKEVPRS